MRTIEFNEEMRRCAVVMCLINNKGNIENSTISKALGIPMRTIQDIRKELERSGDPGMVVKRKAKPQEASRTVREADFVARVQAIIDDDPGKSMRAIARVLKVGDTTVRRCVSQDIRYKSYAMRTGQLLTEAAKQKKGIQGQEAPQQA